MTERQFESLANPDRRDGDCDSIEALQEKDQTNLGFGYICGNRGIQTNLDMVQAKTDTGCKEGYSKCSLTTSKENYVCYKNGNT